jgi:hypothetical protein
MNNNLSQQEIDQLIFGNERSLKMEYNIDQIKQQFCKFKCTAEEPESRLDSKCDNCQIENFIRELEDYKIIHN